MLGFFEPDNRGLRPCSPGDRHAEVGKHYRDLYQGRTPEALHLREQYAFPAVSDTVTELAGWVVATATPRKALAAAE